MAYWLADAVFIIVMIRATNLILIPFQVGLNKSSSNFFLFLQPHEMTRVNSTQSRRLKTDLNYLVAKTDGKLRLCLGLR